jgi:glycerol kinase
MVARWRKNDKYSCNRNFGNVPDNGGVYFVLALTGLGAPLGPICEAQFWVLQEERQTHLARATLENCLSSILI